MKIGRSFATRRIPQRRAGIWPRCAAASILLVCIAAPIFVDAQQEATALRSTVERGPVTATVTVEPATPRIGDPILLHLKVEAEAGVEVLMPEFGQSLDRFQIVDFSGGDKVGVDGGIVSAQRYTLESLRSGTSHIPTILIEFVDHRAGNRSAPEGEDAYELLTERLPFEVASVLPTAVAAELSPPLGALAPLATGVPGTGLYVTLLLTVALLLVGSVYLYARRQLRADTRSAFDVAQEGLDRLVAAGLPDADRMDTFFVNLSGIVRRYLEDGLSLRAPELTTEEFLVSMTTVQALNDSHGRLLQEFLRRADMVKFARHIPGPTDVEEAIAAARRFLQETRETTATAAAPPAGSSHA